MRGMSQSRKQALRCSGGSDLKARAEASELATSMRRSGGTVQFVFPSVVGDEAGALRCLSSLSKLLTSPSRALTSSDTASRESTLTSVRISGPLRMSSATLSEMDPRLLGVRLGTRSGRISAIVDDRRTHRGSSGVDEAPLQEVGGFDGGTPPAAAAFRGDGSPGPAAVFPASAPLCASACRAPGAVRPLAL